MIERKYTGVLLILFLVLMMVYSLIGLFRENKSRAKIIEEHDILMFSASDEVKLDVNLTTFDTQSCHERVEGILEKFDPYTLGLTKITIHHRLDLRRGLASKDKIWIRCLKDLEEFENIFLHELGHIVAQNYLSDNLESAFYDIGGNSVSSYGSEKPEEDFAESFLMYIKYGETFRHIQQDNIFLESKYNFLRDNIFDGHEFGVGIALNEALNDRYLSFENYPYDVSVLHKR